MFHTEGQKEFMHDPVIRWHLYHKLVCEISALLDPSRPTVTSVLSITVKWWMPRSNNSSAMVDYTNSEQGRWVQYSLWCYALWSPKLPRVRISNTTTRTVHWELHEMGFHSQDGAHKPKLTMSSLGWSGVKHTTTRIWSIGNMFSEMMCHFLEVWWKNLGWADIKRILSTIMHSAKSKFWWRDNGSGALFQVWTTVGYFGPVKGKC